MARKIRSGDTVLVLAGKDKGRRGTVNRVLPRAQRVVVSGVNIMTHHIGQKSGTRQTGLVHNEEPIHISNVLLVESGTNAVGRVGWRTLEDGSKERYVKTSRR